MLPLPSDPQPGEGIITWARGVQACLRRLRLTSGPGIRINEGANSTAISADPGKGGGGTPAPQPFALRVETDPDDTSPSPAPKIRVYASTLAGGSSADIGFADGDDPPYLFSPLVGVVQGGLTIDTDGKITSRWLEIVASLSDDTDDTFYVEIGTVAQDDDGNWTTSNSRYGPINATICRNWFAAEAPFYGATFF